MGNLTDKLKPNNKKIEIVIVNNPKDHPEVLLVKNNGKYQLPSGTQENKETNINVVYRICKEFFPKLEIDSTRSHMEFEDSNPLSDEKTHIRTYLVDFNKEITGEDFSINYPDKIKWVWEYESPMGLSEIGAQIDTISKEVIYSLKKQKRIKQQNIDQRTQVFKSRKNIR